jgi:hypothetical protein
MTDSPRRDGPEPTQPLGNSYPGYPDPAYASQAPYGPAYQTPGPPAETEQLPAYSPYGYDPYTTASPIHPAESHLLRPMSPSHRCGCGSWRRSPCWP